jgi:biopolymer transport protein ExbB
MAPSPFQRPSPAPRSVAKFALLVLLLVALAPHAAHAWWNGDWPYRMQITADAGPKGANITQPIGRTQVLIRLFSGNFNFDTADEKGADLRVVAGDDRTPLHFHIERFDGLVDQVGLIWVDVPDLAPGAATTLYLYWGKKNPATGGDAKATYDPDQLLVYHFAEDNGVPHDTTGYGNNALTGGKRDDGGMIGYGLRLDGKSPVQIPASTSLAIAAGAAMTWSLWVRPDDGVTSGVLYSVRDGDNGFSIGIDQGVAYAQVTTAAGVTRTSAGAPLGQGWHHIAVTASDHLRVYVDGEPRGEAAASLPALNALALLGGAAAPAPAATPAPNTAAPNAATPAPNAATPAPTPGAAPQPPASSDATAAPAAAAPPAPPPNFVGVIDEFEISKVVRPAGAFQVALHDQGSKPDLLSFAPPEQGSLFGNSYLGIIVRAVTPDAWVVISILGMMSALSWLVMIGKALYLGRVSRTNHRFRTAFRAATARAAEQTDPFAQLKIDQPRGLRGSPLMRLYTLGAREVNERVMLGRLDQDRRLPVQSLAAIRAALDAGMAHETRRLNRWMVLLTIAISGGPFLGLLGTVMGVMITFAAVAAAGDVNINAIAPGISAALLATVAGLTVAIPALFGYNYFVVRIREATVDMQVFVDELVTRVGEIVAPVSVTGEPQRAAAE